MEENKKFFGNLFMEPRNEEPTQVSQKDNSILVVETPSDKDVTSDNFPEAKTTTEKVVDKVPEKEKEVVKVNISTFENEFFFESYINELAEQGVITEEEISAQEFDNTPEGVKAFISYTEKKAIDKAKQDAINELPEDAKRVIELAREGVDIRQLLEFEQEEIDFEGLDYDDLETQESLYYDYLIATGVSEEKAIKKVKSSFESGDLVEDAKDAADFLNKRQTSAKEELIKSQKSQAKIQAEQAKSQHEAWVKDIVETKQIKGFEISKPESTKLLEFMTKPVDKSGKTQEQLSWEDPETRKAFAYFSMKKFDFKSFEKKAETKATIKLKSKVNNVTDKNTSSKGTKPAEEEKSNTTHLLPKLNLLF